MDWYIVKYYDDIFYYKVGGIVKIVINCFYKCNVFCFQIVFEFYDVFCNVREDNCIGVVLLIGVGFYSDGKYVFCFGGD